MPSLNKTVAFSIFLLALFLKQVKGILFKCINNNDIDLGKSHLRNFQPTYILKQIQESKFLRKYI